MAVCSVGGTDIADWLVRNGLALESPQYSKGDYADARAEAKREQRECGAVASRRRGIIGLADARVEGRKVVRTIELADKHFASVIYCVDDEIIRWLERRERRKRDRLAGSRQSVYRYLP